MASLDKTLENAANAPTRLRKVVGVVRCTALESVEERLKSVAAPGVTVTRVKGYGEYANFFHNDWNCEHVRVEVFCDEPQAQAIASAIIEGAQSGAPGDGIVVVLPVEAMYRVRTGRPVTADDLHHTRMHPSREEGGES